MYSVAIEEGTTGMWYGRFIDFPGTHARADKKSSLLQELHEELLFHVQWLHRHGEPAPSLSSPDVEIAEEVIGIRDLGESGGEVALFQYDIHPVDEEELQQFFILMQYNREDVLSLIDTMPQQSLHHIPEGKTRTILDILNHVCNAEEFYISRLGKKADSLFEYHAGMVEKDRDALSLNERMEVVRTAAVKTLNILVREKEDSIFTRSEYAIYPHEKWTAHKVLRRFLEHEREHYYNIKAYLHQPLREHV
jgi:predicted RNase H-like HicB family nuclease/uncharacterized damage-inducible protein DinB